MKAPPGPVGLGYPEAMRPLAEALYTLQPGQVLSGQTPFSQGVLQLWVHRHEGGFDLYVLHLPEPASEPLRSAVGRDLVSATEVLEALRYLETVYPVQASELFDLPVSLQQATPGLERLIQKRVLRSQGQAGQRPAQLLRLPGVRQEWAGGEDDDIASLIITDADP